MSDSSDVQSSLFSDSQRETLVEVGESLASALHHKNIGRDIRGWAEVSESFAMVKELLNETREVSE